MGEVKYVPKLRFEGFSGEWGLKKFGSVCEKIGSGSTPKGGAEVYQKTGIPFIRSQNVVDSGLVLDNTCISEKINNKMKGSIVEPNDILLNITGGSIGRTCVVPMDFKIGNVNQHVCIIRLAKHSSKFIQSFLTSFKGQKLIFQGQTGSGREGLNFQSIRAFKINLPTLPEQEKIANFLTAVDAKISNLSEEKSLLEQYKKGAMQQLFSHPSNSSGRRELRFKQDDGSDFPEWENKQLQEICSFFSGGTPTSTNKSYYSGKIPFIGSGNITDQKIDQYITQEALNSSSAKLVEKGDLLYALYGATSGEVGINQIEGAINQAVLCIRTINNRMYLYQVLRFNKNNIVSQFIQGGQGNLSAKIIKQLRFDFPTIEEQTKIANFLSAIDEKIATVSEALEGAQAFKKGLLQQLFV